MTEAARSISPKGDKLARRNEKYLVICFWASLPWSTYVQYSERMVAQYGCLSTRSGYFSRRAGPSSLVDTVEMSWVSTNAPLSHMHMQLAAPHVPVEQWDGRTGSQRQGPRLLVGLAMLAGYAGWQAKGRFVYLCLAVCCLIGGSWEL